VPSDAHRDLSEGQRLALVLALQLTAAPEVLLLYDEPTRGLDPTAKSGSRRSSPTSPPPATP
jgi:energy-coupling factor transport system ATP-binding protein